jgi:hypothetical protein
VKLKRILLRFFITTFSTLFSFQLFDFLHGFFKKHGELFLKFSSFLECDVENLSIKNFLMDVLLFSKHVHLNPGTHCFGSPRPELRISGGSCVHNNNPEGVTVMILQESSTTITTTTTTVRPLFSVQNVDNSGWRDFGHVVLGGALLLASLGLIWIWKKHGAAVSSPARRLLSMVCETFLYS